MVELVHDPELARRVHRALVDVGGKLRQYKRFLATVKTLAEANGIRLDMRARRQPAGRRPPTQATTESGPGTSARPDRPRTEVEGRVLEVEVVRPDDPIIVYGPYRRERPRIVTFKISPGELAEVDRAAQALGMSRSELIREALKRYLREVLGWEEWP